MISRRCSIEDWDVRSVENASSASSTLHLYGRMASALSVHTAHSETCRTDRWEVVLMTSLPQQPLLSVTRQQSIEPILFKDGSSPLRWIGF